MVKENENVPQKLKEKVVTQKKIAETKEDLKKQPRVANKKDEKKVSQQRATVEQKKVTEMKVTQVKKPATLPTQQVMNRRRQAVIRPKKR